MVSLPHTGTHFLGHGQDRFAAHRSLGITRVNFKVAAADTEARLFITEQKMLAKGGAAPPPPSRPRGVVLQPGSIPRPNRAGGQTKMYSCGYRTAGSNPQGDP